MVLIERINNLLLEGVTKGDFPGAHYALIDPTGRLIKGYVGYKQLEPTKVPLSGDEIYDVASLTKVVSTTTLVMKLIEQKALSLDTKLVDILPRFTHQGIEIKHLLTHSSGLPADIPRASTLQHKTQVLDHVYSVDLEYPTGTKVVYSDIGYILLGLAIEEITKKTLPEIAKEWIFEPLHMKDTSYVPDRQRCAPTELREDDVFQGFLQGQVHDEKAFALGGPSGHAGLFSTVGDLALFIRMFLEQQETVLAKETMQSMFVPRITSTTKLGNPVIRSYGFDKPTEGGTSGQYTDFEQTILHTGFTGCNLWIDRSHNVGFVMLSNAVHPKRNRNKIIPYRRKIADIIMEYYEGGQHEKTI